MIQQLGQYPKVSSALFMAWAKWRYRIGPDPRNDLPHVAGKLVPIPDAWWHALESFSRWHRARALGEPRPIRRTTWTTVPAWAWLLEKALLAYHPAPPPPSPLPAVEASRWDRFGVMLYSAGNIGADDLCGWLRSIPPEKGGPGWVAIQTHEGPNGTTPTVNPPGYADRCREILGHGDVVAWGWAAGQDAATVDAEAQAAATTSQGYADYILNAEIQWRYGMSFASADRFAATLRQLTDRGSLVSTEVGEQLHFAPLYAAGFRFVAPQGYDAIYPGLTIEYAVKRAVDSVQADLPHGWDPGRVRPMIGTYGPGQAAHYIEQMRAYRRGGGRGLSDYSGEHLDQGDRDAILLGMTV